MNYQAKKGFTKTFERPKQRLIISDLVKKFAHMSFLYWHCLIIIVLKWIKKMWATIIKRVNLMRSFHIKISILYIQYMYHLLIIFKPQNYIRSAHFLEYVIFHFYATMCKKLQVRYDTYITILLNGTIIDI